MTFLLRHFHSQVFVILIFMSISCNKLHKTQVAIHEDLKKDTTQISSGSENKVAQVFGSDEINLETELPEISEESLRFTDENKILHIDLTTSKILMGKQEHLLRKLFVDAEITYTSPNDLYDAFNITYKSNKYNAIVTFEQSNKGVYLSFIYILKGDFLEDNLESLFE